MAINTQPFDYNKYLRPNKLPHIWCPGCGNGIITKALVRAIDSLNIDKNDIAMVSGIGCSSRTPGYLDFNTFHTLHGRAIAFATGVKLAKPKLKVIVVTGDGDATAIGGNHFIHACRRNIELTIIIYNNSIYGMTGGQFSPLTPTGSSATTAPYGNPEPNFDICELAKGAGASFVARGATFYPLELEKLIAQGISHKGVAVIETITPCPTYFGRMNKVKSPAEMMIKFEKEMTLSKAAAEKLPPEERQGKAVRGILHQLEKPAYTEEYEKIIAKAKGN